MTTLPSDHPQRRELNDEVHARPPEPLAAPLRLSYLALMCDGPQRERARADVATLAVRFGVVPPAPGSSHYSADMGDFRLKWEVHSEFIRYTFIRPGLGPDGDPFAQTALEAVPAEWVAALPGQVMVATHAALVAESADPQLVSERYFAGNVLVGAAISGRAAMALTDWRIHPDGYSRLLVQDFATTPYQAGRVVQRLLEIDTYRVMALLALPLARDLAPFLNQCEQELAGITAALVSASVADEPLLLDRLTTLEAEIESRQSANLYRFGAAAAYYDLVQGRIAELREERIQGLQTFQEFTARRLAPAMNTCRSVSGRQDQLSQRVARASRLLSTRVDITHERQNQALLESMNQRARLQLRLQSTVEGLSVAAVTYYIVGLVGYAAKSLYAAGAPVPPDIAVGASIPIVAGLVAWGLHRSRLAMRRKGSDPGEL